jgi:trans-aconitate methyltransferase
VEQHVAIDLVSKGVSGAGNQRWADLGAGSGAFTNALGSLLQRGSTIYAVDTNKRALNSISPAPNIHVEKIIGDFTDETLIPPLLNGIIMANSIHYVADKHQLFRMLIKKLNKLGRIIIVEYDMERPSPWVPYPLSFSSLENIISSFGWTIPEKIGQVPSQLNRSDIYSAVIIK